MNEWNELKERNRGGWGGLLSPFRSRLVPYYPSAPWGSGASLGASSGVLKADENSKPVNLQGWPGQCPWGGEGGCVPHLPWTQPGAPFAQQVGGREGRGLGGSHSPRHALHPSPALWPHGHYPGCDPPPWPLDNDSNLHHSHGHQSWTFQPTLHTSEAE